MNERALRARIEYLEEENRQLREHLSPVEGFPRVLEITEIPARILSLLIARAPRTVRPETVLFAVWGDGSEMSLTNVSTNIFKLRQKLQPYGIRIGNEFGAGYFLPLEAAETLKRWIAAGVDFKPARRKA